MKTQEERRLVWDLPVRVVHWSLLLAVASCYVSNWLGPSWFTWHMVSGCCVLVLAAFRILWGFVGTRHARFAAFLRGPRAMWQYLRGQFRGGHAAEGVGHNPLGGLGIAFMLLLLLGQGLTGLYSNDEIDNVGPLFGWVSDSTSHSLSTLHRQIFAVLQVLILLHVAAVLAYTFIKRVRLIPPMITGYKAAASVPDGEAITRSKSLMALALVTLLAAVLWAIIHVAPEATLSPF